MLPRFVRFRRATLAIAAATLVAGCSDDATSPLRPASLVGRWSTEVRQHLPQGTWQTHLELQADGDFIHEVRLHGIYEGQPAGELSAYSRITGRYTVDGDRMTFTSQLRVTWDRFYGAESQPMIGIPHPQAVFYSDARATVVGNRLTIDYMGIGPTDAIEAQREVFERD